MTETQDWVRITRTIAAPVDTVWAWWTDPAQFARWYGPRGMEVPAAEMDLRAGGARKVAMRPAGADASRTMWFVGTFLEVSPPHRLRYTEAMAQEDGTLIPPSAMGMPEGTPDITEVVVTLEPVEGGTRMTMTHVGVPEGSAGGIGWTQAFDKLGEMVGG